MIIFSRPEFLFLLFAIPVIIFIQINALRTSKRKALKFANFDAIRKISGVELFSKNITILYLNIFIIILLASSLSGIGFTKEVNSSQLSFVLTIDNSRSMGANDLSPSRLEVAKRAAIDFLEMVPEKTKMGVVSFSNIPMIETDMTDDKNVLRSAINNIQLQNTGGTDFLNALITSSNLLITEDSKTIVLMSDGDINLNSIQNIVDYINKRNVVINSLGIGTVEGGTDSTGAIYKLSSDTLRLIAENTGGKYYDVKNLEDFYYSLANLIQVSKKKSLVDLSPYVLIIALILIIIDFYFINNRFRIFP